MRKFTINFAFCILHFAFCMLRLRSGAFLHSVCSACGAVHSCILLPQLSPVESEEILFSEAAAIVGAVLFREKIGKAADRARVVGAARDVESALAAKCIVSRSLLLRDRGMVDLNSLDTHFDKVLYVFLLTVRMRDDGNAARLEDNVDALLDIGCEIADFSLDLGLALLRDRKCVLDELRMLRVLVDALAFEDGEDLRVIVKIISGEASSTSCQVTPGRRLPFFSDSSKSRWHLSL